MRTSQGSSTFYLAVTTAVLAVSSPSADGHIACAVSAAQSSIIRSKTWRLSASKRGSPPATCCGRREACDRLAMRRSRYEKGRSRRSAQS